MSKHLLMTLIFSLCVFSSASGQTNAIKLKKPTILLNRVSHFFGVNKQHARCTFDTMRLAIFSNPSNPAGKNKKLAGFEGDFHLRMPFRLPSGLKGINKNTSGMAAYSLNHGFTQVRRNGNTITLSGRNFGADTRVKRLTVKLSLTDSNAFSTQQGNIKSVQIQFHGQRGLAGLFSREKLPPNMNIAGDALIPQSR